MITVTVSREDPNDVVVVREAAMRVTNAHARDALLAIAAAMESASAAVAVTEATTLTPREAAALLGVSRQYVDKLINDGKLAAARKPGSTHRVIRTVDLDAYIAQRTKSHPLPTPATPEPPAAAPEPAMPAGPTGFGGTGPTLLAEEPSAGAAAAVGPEPVAATAAERAPMATAPSEPMGTTASESAPGLSTPAETGLAEPTPTATQATQPPVAATATPTPAAVQVVAPTGATASADPAEAGGQPTATPLTEPATARDGSTPDEPAEPQDALAAVEGFVDEAVHEIVGTVRRVQAAGPNPIAVAGSLIEGARSLIRLPWRVAAR